MLLRRVLTHIFRSRRRFRLWYHPEYEPRLLAPALPLIGLQPDRIDFLLGRLIQDRIIKGRQVYSSPLASFDDLKRVHPTDYLENVSHPKTVTKIIGFEVNSEEADQVLRSQRRGVGGTLAATEAVAFGTLDIGINLGGGFHHAEAARGMGFCLFNDIAITIRHLRAKGYDNNVAIVDLDYHQGNGNLSVFANDPSVLTYSIHGALWDPQEGKNDIGILLPPGTTDTQYLRKLKETLLPALQRHKPRLVFYIAGNDVLEGDRLGNFALTETGVLRRDIRVMRSIQTCDAKTVLVLGGGYSPMASQCTYNLIAYLTGRRPKIRPEAEPALRAKFTEIATSLTENELSATPLELSEADLLGDLSRITHHTLLLDMYSLHGIEFAFEKYGILAKIRKLGFSDFRFTLDTTDAEKQMVRLYARDAASPKAEELSLLVELVLRRISLTLPAFEDPIQLLDVQWLLIQDPSTAFNKPKPKLPGQNHPGLGIAEDIRELLVQICRRLELDGVSGTPSHYHNATVASRWFKFINPKIEAKLLAMREILGHIPVPTASQYVEENKLLLRDGRPLKWEPSEHVLPVSQKLKDYFDSETYKATVLEECKRLALAGLKLNLEREG